MSEPILTEAPAPAPRFPIVATALAVVTALIAALSLLATLSTQPADVRLGALGLLGGVALILACLGTVLLTGALARLVRGDDQSRTTRRD